MTAPTAPPYNTDNVIVGAATVYLAPKNTPLPADGSVLFDPSAWTGKKVTANGATSLTFSVTTAAGTQTTTALASFSTVTAAQLQTALQALSNVGVNPQNGVPNVAVTGATPGGPFTVTFANRLGAVTLAITAQTGGTGATVTAGLWTPPGATEAGWTFGASKNTQTINIEEQSTPVGKYIGSQSVTIGANLSEDSIANWQFALNAVKTQVAAASGVPGVTVLTMTDELQHYAVALESKNEYGKPRRIYIPDATSAEALSVAYKRASAQRMLNVSFESTCPIDQIVVRSVFADALP